MAMQVAHLITVRQDVIQALEAGDYNAVRQIYRNERSLRNQILIVDEQGIPFYYRFRSLRFERSQDNSRGPQTVNAPNPPTDQMVQDVVPDANNYPELADKSVTTPDGYAYTVQLQPRLPLHELVALQRTHFPIRLGIILIFSILACYWFSHALSKRIRRVQFAVDRMSEGDYLVDSDLSQLGNDELGALAKDVSKLSSRLADSERSRKQMLSDISHELRSPLARLEVATELTRDYAPEATHYLDRIQKESARMNELIAQIIHIQSLELQRYSAHPEDYESVDMVMLLNEIGQDVCFEFQDKQIEWRFYSTASNTDSSYFVLGNREQLHSAFENIIRNAFIHSAPSSKVSADIEMVSPKDEAATLMISIVDQGGGIAEADLERIFQPFVRLDTSRQRPKKSEPMAANKALNNTQPSRHVGGYGLGLAIAQAIVAAHNGQISARNRADGTKGLIVEVMLPV